MQISQIHYRAFLIFSFICAIGCGAKPVAQVAAKQEAVEETSVEVAETPESKLEVPLDKSLMLEDYVEAGVPPCDGPWSGEEMWSAVDALQKLSAKSPIYLPRCESERSGQVFARLVSRDNLDFFRDPARDLEERSLEAIDHLEAGSKIMLLYSNAFKRRVVSGRDLVECLGNQLRMAALLMSMCDESLAMLDMSDANTAGGIEALRDFQASLGEILGGALYMFTKSGAFRRSELKQLLGHITEATPQILPSLPAEIQESELSRLRSLQEDPKLQDLRPELDELVTIAEKAVKTANSRAMQGPATVERE